MSRCRPVRGLYSTATDVLVPPTLLSGQFAAADHSAFFLVFLFPLPTHNICQILERFQASYRIPKRTQKSAAPDFSVHVGVLLFEDGHLNSDVPSMAIVIGG